MKTSALLCSFLLLASQSLFGFALEGQSWTLNRTVVMQLSLGGPRPLSDGFASFNESAQDVLNLWNAHLEHLQFAAVLASPVVPEAGDDEMSAFFTPDVYGEKFGSGVLAVTLLTFRGTVLEESDTLFNATYTWDSYNGDFRSGVIDFHRVALHEFGHTLGLDHPDQAG
ncbi:MAG: matrixin family metalloprotease, partial [Spartobacteria bacterium]